MPVQPYVNNLPRALPPLPPEAAAAFGDSRGGSVPATSLSTGKFEGDFFRMPRNADLAPMSPWSSIQRVDKDGSIVWLVQPESVVPGGIDEMLGTTLDRLGNPVLVVVTNVQDIAFITFDKATGNDSTLLVPSLAPPASGVWPFADLSRADNVQLGSTQFDFTVGPCSDLTRTFVDVLEDGNFAVCAQSADAGKDTFSVSTNAYIVIDSQTGAVLLSDSTDSRAQYITRNRKASLSQIYNSVNPLSGESQTRLSTLRTFSLNGSFNRDFTRRITIPDNPQDFFSLDLSENNPQQAGRYWMYDRGATLGNSSGQYTIGVGPMGVDGEPNPWFNNGSAMGDNVSDQRNNTGYRAFPQPVKICTFGENVCITPVQIFDPNSSIQRVKVVGAYFVNRSEFDAWLFTVADRLGFNNE